MGASASLSTAVFSLAREEYEVKKGEGLNDEDLFNYMKSYIEAKQAELDAQPKEDPVPLEAPIASEPVPEPVVEATPTEEAPVAATE